MAFCQNCGTQLKEGTAFCSNCGQAVQMQPAAGAYGQQQETAQPAMGEYRQQETAQPAMGEYRQQETAQPAMGEYRQQETAQPAMGAYQQADAYGQQGSAYGQQAAAGGYAQPAAGFGQEAYYHQGMPPAQPPKKSKKGLIIGLSVGGTVLVAGIVVLVLWLLGVFDGVKVPGYYKITSLTMNGSEMTGVALSSYLGGEEGQMVLNEDGTGWLYADRQVQDLTWTETAITGGGETLSYQLEKDVLTITNSQGDIMKLTRSDEPAPEKPEIPDYASISGSYYYVMKDGEFQTDSDYDNVFLFDDGDVQFEVEETIGRAIDGYYPYNLSGTDFYVDVDGEIIQGTLENQVLTITIEGTEYTFAHYTTSLYDEWSEYFYANYTWEEETPESKVAGYYEMTYLNNGSSEISVKEFPYLGLGGTENYIVLEEDGEGWLMFVSNIEEFSWDADTLWFENDYEDYTLEEDTLTVSYGENAKLVFERSSGSAPSKPRKTPVEGTLTITNSTAMNFDEVYFIPSSRGFRDSYAWPVIAPGGTIELDLSNTDGNYPCTFDMALYDSDADTACTVYYMNIHDGYSIEIKDGEAEGQVIAVITDDSGASAEVEMDVE